MTNVSKTMLFAFLITVSATVLSLGAFAVTVHADDFGGDVFDGGGFSDFSSYDGGYSDFSSYDGGYSDYSSYDGGYSDYSAFQDSYNPGYYSTDSYNPGSYSVDSYNPGYYETDSYNPGSYETDSYNPGYYETDSYNPGSYETDSYYPGYETYQDQYMQQWAQQQQQQSYSQGGSSSGYTTGGGYTQSGCTSCHQQVPTPGCTRNCTPTPQPPVCTHNCYPTPVCPSGTTGVYPNCHYPTPTCTTCGGSNTNINTNTNTYIDNSIVDNSIVDNSINGSFNTTITTLGQAVAQPIVQYQVPAPYCVISLVNGGAYNAQANLVWSSSNAQSAYISSVGAVAPNGQRYVTGYASQTYSLTVTGQGGTYTCQTQYTPTYVPPAPITPSVSLTQIPYTGLALSPFAAAMYWLSLLSVAAAGGYLLVYYKGGALALAGATMTRRQNHFVVSAEESTEVEAPAVTEVAEEVVEEVAAPAASAFALPTMSETKTRDVMHMIRNASGVPQLVISRA